MAQKQNQDPPTIGFRSIRLLKDQTLGIGSYGKVCKAKCDDLLCAAKIIHETLFDPIAQQQIARHREHRLPFRRFQQECEFMSAIRHPNIVQYLGMHQDPETGLPVLLMELMDDSLNHFLESLQDPLAFHIQINFCHDITLAISYLHSNGIIHRDLSGNNVLLRGNVNAKVTDFGMAKLGDANPRATRISLTMVPGTDAYMPPEAVTEQPVYTTKIDCFAIGVLIIQILTRKWPKPGDRHKQIVNTTDPRFPTIEARASEIERRQNHIRQVDPNHPLLPIALHCLKDSAVERPSAQELCHRVPALKETPQYTESVRSAQEREEQIRELQQQIQEKDDVINEIIQGKKCVLQIRDDIIRDKQQECQQLQTRIHELEQQLKIKSSTEVPAKPHKNSLSDTSRRKADRLKLKWKTAKKPPRKMSRGPDAVVDGDMVYFRPDGTRNIYGYNSTDDTWNQLPDCPAEDCSLAVVNHLLTTIGGRSVVSGRVSGGKMTDQLFSLTGKGRKKTWSEVFPPMPTKRGYAMAVCSGQALIVAGGSGQNATQLTKVEVMNIATKQWSTAADLPEPLDSASATICGDCIYMLGGIGGRKWTNSVYTCSLADLLRQRSIGERLSQSLLLTARSTVWNKIADLPVTQSTCVTLHGQLLAMGGQESNYKPTSDINIYDATSNQWELISKVTVARFRCFAAVLPSNKLMVAGGYTGHNASINTDSVETANII